MSGHAQLVSTLSTLMVSGYAAAALISLRQGLKTRDLLFLVLSVAFGLMASTALLAAITGDPLKAPGNTYFMRVLAFLLVSLAITRQMLVEETLGAERGRLKVCLAASGGGHLRQLLDLEQVWAAHDSFFVTERTALSESLAESRRLFFVPHVAMGQARLGRPVNMLAAAFTNFWASASIIVRERPAVVISTGAGSVYFILLLGRFMGARVIGIESFARFERPSLFMRLASPLADELIVQSAALSAFWPKARVFDPLRVLDGPRPAKKPLLFATVGATLPFDRLVDWVAALAASGDISHEVVIQTGVGGRAPQGMTVVETLPFDQVQALLRDADIVVCHGGTGSLIMALRAGCHVIALPREFELGEHYDDHQAEIATAFSARGLIAVARTRDELALAVRDARHRRPVIASTDHMALAAHLQRHLALLASRAPTRNGAALAKVPS